MHVHDFFKSAGVPHVDRSPINAYLEPLSSQFLDPLPNANFRLF